MGNEQRHLEEIELIDLIFRKAGIDTASKIKIPNPTNPKKPFCDVDVLGIYKNIVIFVECVGEEKFGYKAKDFNSEVEKIRRNPKSLHALKDSNTEFFDKHKKTIEDFKNDTIVIKKLIVSSKKDETIEEKKTWRGELFVWGREEIEYFKVISDAAYRYCKFEIFKDLKIDPTDIMEEKHPIPKKRDIIGIGEEDRERYLVSFLYPVSHLLKLSFISRYHCTEEKGFQRLANKEKLRKMRQYLIKKGESYPNSLIVLLNPDVKINKFKNFFVGMDKEMQKYCKKNLFKITIPDRFGVFLIIDGQHRLFSFAQDCYSIFEKSKNKEERKKFKEDDSAIKKLAKELQLAVTGIKFKNKDVRFFREAGGELFFKINTTHTKIKPEDVIDLMEKFYPDDPISKSNKLLKKLNAKGPLANKIKVKFWQSKRIKRTSLIMYGGIKSIFDEESKSKITFPIFNSIFKSQKKIKKYLDFCHIIITNYLFALKELVNEKYKSKCNEIWSDIGLKNYYLTSAVGVGALLRLLRHLLTEKDKAFKLKEKITDQIFENDLEKNIRNPKIIELFKTPIRIVFDKFKFTMDEFKEKGYASNKWAQIEADMYHAIKDTKGGFGDITLLKKQFRKKI